MSPPGSGRGNFAARKPNPAFDSAGPRRNLEVEKQMSDSSTIESPITLTLPAVEQIKLLQRQPDHAGKFLRVYVEQGGCSGMQYGMTFDEQRDGDLISGSETVKVLVDAISAKYLGGTQVDFSEELTGGGFKINNPNAKQSCGCGKSFQT